ncbi:MAG: butyrate kinase [Rikenellaceae bacterium]
MSIKILAINPGSTSTKIALFNDEELLFEKSISHDKTELAQYKEIADQFDFRKKVIVSALEEWEVSLSDINVVVGRGGMVKPIESGVYEINDALVHDLKVGVSGKHASNLGGIIARSLAEGCENAKSYIADPVVVDELSDIARVSGCKEMPRKSIFHALNQKAVARDYAEKIGKPYEELNLIVAHMGGGVSVGAHYEGKVVDVNNALSGDGPFSPERSGTLIAADILEMAFSKKYTYEQLYSMVVGKGGFISLLGTSNVKSIVDKALEGCKYEKLVIDSFAYNVAKSIAAMSAVFCGKVDAIILTGGIAYSDYICSAIISRVSHLAKIEVFAGEDEMHSLAHNGLLAYNGDVEIKVYN